MANRRRQKKNGSKESKNLVQNENRSDFRDEPKNSGKKDGLPKENSDFIVKSMKGKRKSETLSETRSKTIQITEKGFFGSIVEAIPIKEKCLTQKSRIDVGSVESWKGKRHSRNRLEKVEVLHSTITKRYRKSNKLRAISILKDFKKSVKMEEFFSFNKINIERLKCCFSYQNVTVGKLNLNETLFRSKSLKNPLSNVVFESIRKRDGFMLLNKEMGLTYLITSGNTNPNLSRENIYFTLNCIECNDSVFICQSLDSLFSFKTSKHNRLCEDYKIQQNYLSLIYNGCFFPTLIVKNCPKCSSIKADDNLKTDYLNYSLMDRNENLSQATSFSQINTANWVKDLNSCSTEKNFLPQKCLNNCCSMILENNSNSLHEQNAIEGNLEQGSTFFFEPLNLPASPESLKCFSPILCDCNSVCNYSYIGDSIQISNSCGANLNFPHYLTKICNNNCMRCLNYSITDVPVVENKNYKDTFQSVETPNVEVMAELRNLNSDCRYSYFPNTKTESKSTSDDRRVNDESLICTSNSPNVNNNLKAEFTNSKELDNSNGSNTYSDINETAINEAFVENVNKDLNKSSYQNFEDCIDEPECTCQNQSCPLPSNNPDASCANLYQYSNQMFNGVGNHNSCLYSSNYESNLQNWNCSQCFIPYKNSCNIFIPIQYSDDRETRVPEVKAQNNMDFSYLHGYEEIDFENDRKHIVNDQCFLLEANKETEGVNSNRKEVRMCTNDKYSNINEIKRENQLIPKISEMLQTGVPKYMDSYVPSYTETRNLASEYELPSNDLLNISNFHPFNSYNTNYLNTPGNIFYNTYPRIPCQNENSNSHILSTLHDTANFSVYDNERYSSCRSYRTASDTFHNSNISRFPNECTFAFHKYTKHRGNYYKNGIDGSKHLFRNNYESLNSKMRNEKSWKSFNYNHKRKHFIQSSFRSSLEFFRNYGNSFQKYKKQDSYIPNYRNQKFSVSPSKSNFLKSSYNRGNFSHYGYEHKRIKSSYRETLNHPQEQFFNAAANPNSYT